MIASFERSFCFIRTRKTASTSVEIVLGSWCGEQDIVVPVGVDDEIIRRRYGGEPRNFCTDSKLERDYRDAFRTEDAGEINSIYSSVMRNLRYRHHMSAVEARSMLPADFWTSAFKFCVDRHPYEKVVSLTYWRFRNHDRRDEDFGERLELVIDKGDYRNFDLYSENGEVMLDAVLRYETLWEDLTAVAKRLGAAIPQDRPNAKAQYRLDRRPAADILTDRQKARIFERCREEFDLLGYEP